MPNIKSAKKRVKVIEKKTLRNNMIKSGYKSAVKKFEQAVEAGNIDEAKFIKKIKCSYGLSKIKIMHSFYFRKSQYFLGFFCYLFPLLFVFPINAIICIGDDYV